MLINRPIKTLEMVENVFVRIPGLIWGSTRNRECDFGGAWVKVYELDIEILVFFVEVLSFYIIRPAV